MRYANVILPVPLNDTFTYIIPVEYESILKPGFRVIVPFGKRKYYTGIVDEITDECPEGFEIKEIFDVPDLIPILKRPQKQLWEWISDYYLCTLGETYRAALPAGLKIESETLIEYIADQSFHTYNLNEREKVVLTTLQQASKKISVGELEKKTGFNRLGVLIERLIDIGLIAIHENIVERYKPKKEKFIKVLFSKDETSLKHVFELVRRSKKQETTILALIELSNMMKGICRDISLTSLKDRINVPSSILQSLSQKGLIQIESKEISRFDYTGEKLSEYPILSPAQQKALDQIHASWIEKDVTLLHGVTSSGKTEIYIHLADFVLKKNRQVLYLVPEIALTTQLTKRLQKVFGEKVVIYHSKFTDNERVEIWKKLLHSEKPYIIIGARSAVFLPFGHLGLVIVDEEHDASYKQQDPAPRYNGRDTAIVLSRMHGAKTLLGSATPAIDTYYKAITGKYGLVNLLERYGDSPLPEIAISDCIVAKRRGLLSGPLTTQTLETINNSIKSDNQSIIFLNRRGYAPIVECKSCAWTPKCEHCDVTLTYHKKINKMVCHYCGAEYPLPNSCPVCHEPSIETLGYGTERMEDEIEALFPTTDILRMDRDTTRNKDDYEQLIESFSQGESHILVGTQMVTKGLDFGKVDSVAVINTDALLNQPDFRSAERAFNTIDQVAGRCGRRSSTGGKVVIQAYSADHYVLKYLLTHDYKGFYNYEIEQRKKYLYPPFTRLIYIYIKHRDKEAVDELAIAYCHQLHHLFGNRVFGPEEPYVSRIQSLYIRKIMLKIEIDASMLKVRQILRNLYLYFHSSGHPYIKTAQIYYDVDPV